MLVAETLPKLLRELMFIGQHIFYISTWTRNSKSLHTWNSPT